MLCSILPVYVSRYAVTTKLLLRNPAKSSAMATKDVLTMVVSSNDKNSARHKLWTSQVFSFGGIEERYDTRKGEYLQPSSGEKRYPMILSFAVLAVGFVLSYTHQGHHMSLAVFSDYFPYEGHCQGRFDRQAETICNKEGGS